MQEKAKNTKPMTVEEFMNGLFSKDVETTHDLFEDSAVKTSNLLGEHIVQVRVEGGAIYELKTGKFSEKAALKEVPFAIQYCQENFGKVLGWNWKGQENILHTPHSVNQPRKSFRTKVLNYLFDLED
ncbi:hypothetical protein [Virgibacillus halodenitrificans]|uniref:hypothetical protein n=1 Tax=Virgibacillus halodenitrificans TaxID=1482 RepID=UPI000EF50A6C|nr:hypothetical protein [Virgibacillus halodenitrificans]